jgi:hypothetical protein
MKISDQPFAAKVELPCKLFCESGSRAELSGIVTNIDTGSLLLQLQASPNCMDLGDRARLEVTLPLGSGRNIPKYLSLRARLIAIEERPNGMHRLRFKLWKFKFADRIERKANKAANASGLGWRM